MSDALTAHYAEVYAGEAGRLGDHAREHLEHGNAAPAKALAREAYRCAVYAETFGRGRWPDKLLPIVAGTLYASQRLGHR